MMTDRPADRDPAGVDAEQHRRDTMHRAAAPPGDQLLAALRLELAFARRLGLDTCARLCDAVEALDQHLVHGGLPPRAWTEGALAESPHTDRRR